MEAIFIWVVDGIQRNVEQLVFHARLAAEEEVLRVTGGVNGTVGAEGSRGKEDGLELRGGLLPGNAPFLLTPPLDGRFWGDFRQEF